MIVIQESSVIDQVVDERIMWILYFHYKLEITMASKSCLQRPQLREWAFKAAESPWKVTSISLRKVGNEFIHCIYSFF